MIPLALQGMQERQLITLEDAAVVTWPEDRKKPQTRQLSSMGGAGALGGAFWGFLFGLIFFIPLLGLAMGAAMGGLVGSLTDVGIDAEPWNYGIQAAVAGLGVVSLLAFLLAFRPKTPTSEEEREVTQEREG